MSPWPRVRLGEVLRRSNETIEPCPDSEYREITVRLWGNGVVERGRVAGAALSGRRFVAREGQFIVSRIDARNGAAGLVPAALDGALVSNDFPLFDFDRTRLLPACLGWLSKTAGFIELCRRASEGTTNRVRLKEGAFLSLEIQLPPLPEQQRLVALIDEVALAGAVASALDSGQVADAEAMLVSLAHRADFATAEKTKRGWRLARLGDVMRQVEQLSAVDAASSYPNFGIYSFGRGLFEKPPIQGFSSSAVKLNRVRKGQFIYSRLFAFEGAYAMVCDRFHNFFASNEYPTFDCAPDRLLPEFLIAYLKPAAMWQRVAVGSKGLGDRRQRVQPAQLLGHELWLPPVEDQRRIASVMREVSALQAVQAARRAELDALLPAVLDRAFAGTL